MWVPSLPCVEHLSIIEVLDHCVSTFVKSRNKEGRAALPKLYYGSEHLCREKSDSLGVCMVRWFYQIK